MNIQEALTYGRKRLMRNILSYDIDAKLLLMDVLNIDKVTLLTSREEITNDDFLRYENYLIRREKHEPVAYILGYIYFMDLKFFVNPSVLIPRGDTEILVYKALELINKYKFKAHLDMCCGSGCIPISLTVDTNINSTGIDISRNALDIFQKNILFHKLEDKIQYIESDLFSNINMNNKYDIITSNPPYITGTEMIDLMDDVKNFEPHLALYGGNDGLDFYRNITSTAYTLLNNGGYLIYEIGYNQGEYVKDILMENNFTDIEILNDLNKNNRVVLGRKI